LRRDDGGSGKRSGGRTRSNGAGAQELTARNSGFIGIHVDPPSIQLFFG
jgi:hypothetical protein